MKETITLSSREIQRIQALEQVCRGIRTLVGSIPLLLVSYRQAKRLLARYREEGAAGLAHRRRGERAHNAYGPEMRDRVMGLHQKRYAKFNDTHFVEMLAEREEIRIGRETVRGWLVR
jgi:transposase